jgi:hypothetical protein
MGTKYEFTDETCEYKGYTLRRIQALTAIPETDYSPEVKAGDLGGWIENEANLSDEGTAWVYSDSKVYELARVEGDARVVGPLATVSGQAVVRGNAILSGMSVATAAAVVEGHARLTQNAHVGGYTHVTGDAQLRGDVYLELPEEAAPVTTSRDFCTFRAPWTSGLYLTYSFNEGVWYHEGFRGTSSQLIESLRENELAVECCEALIRLTERLSTR